MPKLIKDFRITEKHQGGMAVVYKGENPSGFKRAFKAVRPDKAVNNAKLCDKFLKGISILQQLDHPNIVKAQDAFTYKDDEDGTTYTVLEMEWLDGLDLQQYVKQKSPKGLSVREVEKICLRVIEGFIYAHNRNVLHLDIKPNNLFRTRDGYIKIIDFGISKLIGESADIVDGAEKVSVTKTETGESTFRGTIAYASPEQWKGEEVTKASDIYSFGRTLHFLLTGSDESSAVVTNAKFKAIIRKCCSNFPDERYQSFTELKKVIEIGEETKCVNPQCGRMLPRDTKFCPHCGAQQVIPKPCKCPGCGAEMLPSSKFCTSCGHGLGDTPPPPKKTKQWKCNNCQRMLPQSYNDDKNHYCCYCGSPNMGFVEV